MEGFISDKIDLYLDMDTSSMECQLGIAMYSEYLIIRREVQNRISLVLLSGAVKHGGASGKIGELDCSTINTELLVNAIQFTKDAAEEAKNLHCRHHRETTESDFMTREVSLFLQNATLILRIRNALLESHWGHLEKAILDSKAGAVIEFIRDEVLHARYECENRQIFEQLSEALEHGRPLAIGSNEWTNLNRDRNDIFKMMSGLDMKTVDTSMLKNAIATADRFECRTAAKVYKVACLIVKLRKAFLEIPTLKGVLPSNLSRISITFLPKTLWKI